MASYSEKPTSYVEIDLDALVNNINCIKRLAGDSRTIIAVVKDDAYGHGMEAVSRCAWNHGVTHFAVVTVEEGIALRRFCESANILVMGEVLSSAALNAAVHTGLELTVSDPGCVERASTAARSLNRAMRARLHLKIDTGMSRLGAMPAHIPAILDAFREHADTVRLAGVFTHLAHADEIEGAEYTNKQLKQFKYLIEKNIAPLKLDPPPLVHTANSAGIVNYPESHLTAVRPGLLMYGVTPNYIRKEVQPLGIRPVLRLKSHVTLIKRLPEGTAISYGCTYTCRHDSRIAVVPVGYGHGYPRALSNRGHMLIRGVRVPIVGRVCMDMTMVDTTEIPDEIAPGEPVVLIGSQGDAHISVGDVAIHADTIPYEVLCSINSKLPHLYLPPSE